MEFRIGDIVGIGCTRYRVTHINPYKNKGISKQHIGVRLETDKSTLNRVWGWSNNKDFKLIQRYDPQMLFDFMRDIV